MMKFGLNLRIANPPPKPLLANPFGFNDDDDDDIETQIAVQASKNLKKVEEQLKKALEQDPNLFDFDGCYDKIKEVTRPLMQDCKEKEPKYIPDLIMTKKERDLNREIVFEKKVVKERSKDDHLYADKDKFVTKSYRIKLAERENYMELESFRELQEEREDVTKKKDFLFDLYANLNDNVTFGVKVAQGRKHDSPTENTVQLRPNSDLSAAEENSPVEQPSAAKPYPGNSKRSHDEVAAAKERFLARKQAKKQ